MIRGLIIILAALSIFMLLTSDWSNIYEILWWGLLTLVFVGLAIGIVDARVGKK